MLVYSLEGTVACSEAFNHANTTCTLNCYYPESQTLVACQREPTKPSLKGTYLGKVGDEIKHWTVPMQATAKGIY